MHDSRITVTNRFERLRADRRADFFHYLIPYAVPVAYFYCNDRYSFITKKKKMSIYIHGHILFKGYRYNKNTYNNYKIRTNYFFPAVLIPTISENR